MEKYNLTSLHFLLNVFIDDCISLCNISREIEKKNSFINKTYRASKKNEHLFQTKYYTFYQKNIHLVLVALNNISYASAYSLHTSNILFNASRDGGSKVISSAYIKQPTK